MLQLLGEVGLEGGLTIAFLVAMRVLAGLGPDPDLETFGPLEDGE